MLSSKYLLRANPALTSNYKLLVDTNYSLFLESYDANKELSDKKYKKFQVTKDSFLSVGLSNFYKNLPAETAFEVKNTIRTDAIQNDINLQFDDTYYSGARNVSDTRYQEEFQYNTTLKLNPNNLPKYFFIYRINGKNITATLLNEINGSKFLRGTFDGTTYTPNNSITLNSNDLYTYTIANSSLQTQFEVKPNDIVSITLTTDGGVQKNIRLNIVSFISNNGIFSFTGTLVDYIAINNNINNNTGVTVGDLKNSLDATGTPTNTLQVFSIYAGINNPAKLINVTNTYFFNDIVESSDIKQLYNSNAQLIKSFDLTKNSDLGQYLAKNYIEDEVLPISPFELNLKQFEFSKWNGYDYETGGLTSKSFLTEELLNTQTTHFELEKFITDGFKKNKIIAANYINLSYLFNDKVSTKGLDNNNNPIVTHKKWSINGYAGYYINKLNNILKCSPYDFSKIVNFKSIVNINSVIVSHDIILSTFTSINPFPTLNTLSGVLVSYTFNNNVITYINNNLSTISLPINTNKVYFSYVDTIGNLVFPTDIIIGGYKSNQSYFIKFPVNTTNKLDYIFYQIHQENYVETSISNGVTTTSNKFRFFIQPIDNISTLTFNGGYTNGNIAVKLSDVYNTTANTIAGFKYDNGLNNSVLYDITTNISIPKLNYLLYHTQFNVININNNFYSLKSTIDNTSSFVNEFTNTTETSKTYIDSDTIFYTDTNNILNIVDMNGITKLNFGVLNINDTPLEFTLYSAELTDISDFDFDRMVTDYTKIEYDKKNKVNYNKPFIHDIDITDTTQPQQPLLENSFTYKYGNEYFLSYKINDIVFGSIADVSLPNDVITYYDGNYVLAIKKSLLPSLLITGFNFIISTNDDDLSEIISDVNTIITPYTIVDTVINQVITNYGTTYFGSNNPTTVNNNYIAFVVKKPISNFIFSTLIPVILASASVNKLANIYGVSSNSKFILPTSSEYSATSDLYILTKDNILTDIWQQNQYVNKFGFMGSISNSNYQYKLNNNLLIGGIWNQSPTPITKDNTPFDYGLEWLYSFGTILNKDLFLLTNNNSVDAELNNYSLNIPYINKSIFQIDTNINNFDIKYNTNSSNPIWDYKSVNTTNKIALQPTYYSFFVKDNNIDYFDLLLNQPTTYYKHVNELAYPVTYNNFSVCDNLVKCKRSGEIIQSDGVNGAEFLFKGIKAFIKYVITNNPNTLSITEKTPANDLIDYRCSVNLIKKIVDSSTTTTMDSVPATHNGTPYTIVQTAYSPNYGSSGAYFYDTDNITVIDSVNTVGSIWNNASSINPSRVNIAGIWTTASSTGVPYNEWVGFSVCLPQVSTKSYYIAISADNFFRFTINNAEIINSFTGGNPSNANNFFRHNIYRITLPVGQNILTLEGYNTGGYGLLYCEVFDNTESEIRNATNINQLNLIFSSKDKVGQQFDIGMTTGYSCPIGYTLDKCTNPLAPVCTRFTTTNKCGMDIILNKPNKFLTINIYVTLDKKENVQKIDVTNIPISNFINTSLKVNSLTLQNIYHVLNNPLDTTHTNLFDDGIHYYLVDDTPIYTLSNIVSNANDRTTTLYFSNLTTQFKIGDFLYIRNIVSGTTTTIKDYNYQIINIIHDSVNGTGYIINVDITNQITLPNPLPYYLEVSSAKPILPFVLDCIIPDPISLDTTVNNIIFDNNIGITAKNNISNLKDKTILSTNDAYSVVPKIYGNEPLERHLSTNTTKPDLSYSQIDSLPVIYRYSGYYEPIIKDVSIFNEQDYLLNFTTPTNTIVTFNSINNSIKYTLSIQFTLTNPTQTILNQLDFFSKYSANVVGQFYLYNDVSNTIQPTILNLDGMMFNINSFTITNIGNVYTVTIGFGNIIEQLNHNVTYAPLNLTNIGKFSLFRKIPKNSYFYPYSNFGSMSETLISKVYNGINPLQSSTARYNTNNKFPLIDEHGMTTINRNIFKSNWDNEFYYYVQNNILKTI